MRRYPKLQVCERDILAVIDRLASAFSDGNKLLIMGNGGSSADAEHFCGELMKGFLSKRLILSGCLYENLEYQEPGLASQLQGSLPAISLGVGHSVISAIQNDMNPEMVFAQQILGLAFSGDIVFGISTSGNSKNIVNGLNVAKAKKATTVVLTGQSESLCSNVADLVIQVPAVKVHEVQEYHLPIYHAICYELEKLFFVDSE